MIDAINEDLIDLRQACREKPFRNPKTNKPAHIASLYRHVLRGARDANGSRVRLETIRTPSGLRTSREAIQRFIERLTDPDGTSRESAPIRTRSQRERQVNRDDAELAAAGY